VMSTVVRILPRAAPPVAVQDERLLFQVIQAAFAQRRKMLANALGHAFQQIDPQTLRRILEDIGIAATRRGETLSLDEFARRSDVFPPLLAGQKG
jgi:16S rRNA (adenine1518-N6/adenine1519-N6)-dimethyltransferase